MKFDKFMEHCFRVLCLVTALVVAVGLISSCGQVKACAEDLGMFYDAKEFYFSFTEQMEEVTHNAAISINDSNLPQAQKNAILKVLAMQEIALHAMNSDYDGDNAPSGDTIIISGSAYAGYYRYHGELKPCFIYPVPIGQDFNSGQHYTIASAPDFQVDLVFNKENNSDRFYSVDNSGVVRVTPDFGSFTYTDVMNSSFFKDSSVSFYRTNSTGWYTDTSNHSIPSYSDGANNPLWKYCYTNSSLQASFCGRATETTIPEAEVDSEKPWEYYNNHLLPEIRSQFPDIENTYICFPDGYKHTDPSEPSTLPNGGITINNKNTNFNIGINIIYPTDSNGQPITDTSGETVTETAYITDTSPVDGEYNFQMPTLPSLNVPQETIPPPRLSDFSDGLNFIWTSTSNILEESGFLPAVVCVLSLCVLGYILWHIGG